MGRLWYFLAVVPRQFYVASLVCFHCSWVVLLLAIHGGACENETRTDAVLLKSRKVSTAVEYFSPCSYSTHENAYRGI